MTLSFFTVGDKSKPALLFLHGFLGSKEDWEGIMQSLLLDFFCLAIDLPGHGLSLFEESEAYEMDSIALEITRVLDAFQLPRVTLIGYSMGGRVGLYTCLKFIDRFHGLVMVSASPNLETEQERIKRKHEDFALAKRLEKEDFKSFVEDWYKQPLFDTLANHPFLLAKLREKRLQNSPRHLSKALMGMGLGNQKSLWHLLPTFSLPLGILVGERDQKYLEIGSKIAALAPQSHLKVILDAGHNVYEENPPFFLAQLLEFDFL